MAINIQENISIAPYTTFKIGGNARWFANVSNAEHIQEALFWAKEKQTKVFLLGGGSNILVSDNGFDGLVIRMEEGVPLVEGSKITAFSGSILKSVVILAKDRSLGGMEYLYGIPGSVGGAVRGNAGAFGVEIKDVVSSVKVIERQSLEIITLTNTQCHFSYRSSVFKERGDMVVVEAVFSLKEGKKEELELRMEETDSKRNARQNQSAQCAGSFFVNPVVSNEALRKEFEKETGAISRENKVPAGWLIDRVGLRGKRIGGAMVSETHPNYILNAGGASASDVVMLMSYIKQQVRDKLGVELAQEVEFVGF